MGMVKFLKVAILIFAFGGIEAAALDNPANFNFDGVLVNGGTPMTGPVNIKFQVYNPTANCLLFEEDHSAVALDTAGAFSLKVGSGVRVSPGVDGGVGWKVIMANNGTVKNTSTAGCGPGYIPASNDGRLLRVTVNGSTVLAPDFPIGSVPFATTADTLQGFMPSDFVSASTSLLKVYNGAYYVGITAPSLGGNLFFTWPSNYGTTNQVLTTDGSGILSWSTPAGGGLPTSGGAMSGAIIMAGNNITGIGNVGVGTTVPMAPLHAYSSTPGTQLKVESTGRAGVLLSGSGYDSSITQTSTMGYPVMQLDLDNDSQYEMTFQRYAAGVGKFGIGTDNPWALFEVHSQDSMNIPIAAVMHSDTPAVAPSIQLQRSRGTTAGPTDILAGDRLGSLNFHGFAAGFSSIPGAKISAVASENWTGSMHGSEMIFETAPNGSGVLQPRMFIGNNGNVGIGITGPAEKLDVMGNIKTSGEVQIGYTGASCTGRAGAVRYNSGPGILELCDGTIWKAVTTKQVMVYNGNSTNAAFPTNTSSYAPLSGSYAITNTAPFTSWLAGKTSNPVTRNGVLRNLRVKISQSVTNWVISVYRNGTPTGITCSTSATTGCSDLANSLGVIAGDDIGIRIDSDATGASGMISWAVELESP
jgi:hypothetical protein